MERQGEIFTQDVQTVTWPTFFVPTLTMPELASNGGSVIEMFHPVPRDVALDDWDENRKEQLTSSAIRALERHHDLDIAVTRIRSPRDFLRVAIQGDLGAVGCLGIDFGDIVVARVVPHRRDRKQFRNAVR
jgi:hypothetical protein